MIHGKEKEFIAGKVFKFLGEMTKEERAKEISHTRNCINCNKKKRKECFKGKSLICLKCEEENE